MKKLNKQERVLNELWRGKSEMNINELVIMTEFTKKELYNALDNLKRRRLVIIEKEVGKAGYKIPPIRNLQISLNQKQEKRVKELIGR